MSRIRTIKPEFWTSEQIVECSTTARLLFVGMWNFADDGGNIPASAKTLKMQIFPADNIDVSPLVEELLSVGLLVAYSVSGRNYWHITGWRHQKIDRPSYKYPAPDGAKFDEHSTNIRRAFDERHPPEGKGREGNSSTTLLRNVVVPSDKPKRAKPKTKISEDAQPTDKDRAAAISAGLTDSDFRSQWQKFRDYHLSRGNLMADWQAAWRTWLGNVRQYQRPPPKAFSTEKTDWAARALLDIEAKMEIQNGQHPQNTTAFEALEFLSIDSKSSC